MMTGLLTNQSAFLVANSLSPPAFNLFNPIDPTQGIRDGRYFFEFSSISINFHLMTNNQTRVN